MRRFNKIELQSNLLGINVLLSVVKRAIWTCREQWWVKGDIIFHPACLQTGRCFNQDAHWTLKQHQLGKRSTFGRFFAILREERKTCHPLWFMLMVYMYLPRYSNLKLRGWTDGEIATKMWILTPKEIRQTQLSPCALLEWNKNLQKQENKRKPNLLWYRDRRNLYWQCSGITPRHSEVGWSGTQQTFLMD